MKPDFDWGTAVVTAGLLLFFSLWLVWAYANEEDYCKGMTRASVDCLCKR
jgi:hypothetical protein